MFYAGVNNLRQQSFGSSMCHCCPIQMKNLEDAKLTCTLLDSPGKFNLQGLHCSAVLF